MQAASHVAVGRGKCRNALFLAGKAKRVMRGMAPGAAAVVAAELCELGI